MSLLWEKSAGWRWLVRRTRDSKPFFFTFAALCGVVPGVIGFCVMQATNTRSDELESHLRRTSRPESNILTEEFFLHAVHDPYAAMLRFYCLCSAWSKKCFVNIFTRVMMMGQVNKERLAEFLGEIQRKQDTNDRYVAALKGETLTRKPYVRIQPVPNQTPVQENKTKDK